jgi:uncharacterized protein (DUF1330 family)
MRIILSIFALLFALPALAQERATPSYLVVLGVVTDRAKVGEYAKALAPIYETNGGRYVGIGGPGRGVTCVAGPCEKRSAVIVQFKDYATLDNFWWGEPYRTAMRLRDRAGVFTVYGMQSSTTAPAPGAALLLTLSRAEPGNRNDAALELARISNKAKSLTTGFVGDYTAMEGDGPYNRVELLAFPSEVDRIGYLAHPSVKEFLRPRAGLWVEMLAIDPPPPAPAAPPPTKTP